MYVNSKTLSDLQEDMEFHEAYMGNKSKRNTDEHNHFVDQVTDMFHDYFNLSSRQRKQVRQNVFHGPFTVRQLFHAFESGETIDTDEGEQHTVATSHVGGATGPYPVATQHKAVSESSVMTIRDDPPNSAPAVTAGLAEGAPLWRDDEVHAEGLLPEAVPLEASEPALEIKGQGSSLKPTGVNPFAMPPLDTAGQDPATTIHRLTMLEREVADQHNWQPPLHLRHLVGVFSSDPPHSIQGTSSCMVSGQCNARSSRIQWVCMEWVQSSKVQLPLQGFQMSPLLAPPSHRRASPPV